MIGTIACKKLDRLDCLVILAGSHFKMDSLIHLYSHGLNFSGWLGDYDGKE